MNRVRLVAPLVAALIASLPATARANSFDALADFVFWLGLVLLYVIGLLVVSVVAIVGARRRSERRGWKARFARRGFVGVVVVAAAMFVVTVLISAQHGPVIEGFELGLTVLVPPLPVALLLRRLGRHSEGAEEEEWAAKAE